MTLRIYALDPCQTVPRDVVLELRCDGHRGDLFPPASVIFPCDPWYPAAHSAAVRTGWRFAEDGRQFGPCCRGKKVAEEG